MGVISAEDFAKGRCFQEASLDSAEAPPPSRRLASKPFCPPSMLGKMLHSGAKPGEEPTCRPRHDPFAPGVQIKTKPFPVERRQKIKTLEMLLASPVWMLYCYWVPKTSVSDPNSVDIPQDKSKSGSVVFCLYELPTTPSRAPDGPANCAHYCIMCGATWHWCMDRDTVSQKGSI